MITCQDFTRGLQPFLDDLLQEADYQAMHAHAAGCPSCRAQAQAVGSLSYVIKLLGSVPAPADLSETVIFRLRQ